MSEPSQGRSAGFLLVLIATGLVGIAGYVITWLVPRVVGVGPYATFAVFWAALFLLIAALSGIQQETTRAVRTDRSDAPPRARASVFAVGAGLLVLVLVPLTAPLWIGAIFGGAWELVWPLAVASASYVPLAVITGTLYARRAWRSIFVVIVVEGLLRLGLIGLVLAFTSAMAPLAWAVAAPTPVAAVVGLIAIRRSGASAAALDVGYRRLSWNTARTVVAAASMGVLVSGFPALLTATSREASTSELGLVILAATLVRAPLIVVAMAAQSYLIVQFRGAKGSFFRLLWVLEAGVVAAGAVLGALAWLIGPAVFVFLFPGTTPPGGWVLGAFVATAGVLAGMCVSAPALLVLGRHSIVTAGWVLAAGGTILALLLPLPLDQRAALALLVGPAAGLLVHTGFLLIARRSGDAASAVQ
ncbi:hypothetical protein [Leifsonia aquatica]|uniref:hypothetical protein n=1 Tax=Leifsonia aquatica TaxID=144185 RepID=UPI003827656E